MTDLRSESEKWVFENLFKEEVPGLISSSPGNKLNLTNSPTKQGKPRKFSVEMQEENKEEKTIRNLQQNFLEI